MDVVLLILQILGWVLLVALALVILVLLVLLFCPVRYSIEGEMLERKWARAKVHWLLHLFRVRVSYEDDLVYGEAGVLWKKYTFSHDFTKNDEEDEELQQEDKSSDSETSTSESVDSASKPEEVAEKVIGTETAAELRGEVPEEESQEEQSEESSEEESVLEAEETVTEDSDDDVAEKTVTDDAEEGIISKIKGMIERIKEIYPKLKKILTDEKNQEAVTHIKNEIIYLIKILLPKKSKLDAVYSTGSPDTTGQLFGVLAFFPAMYQKTWKVIPDFESDEAYFKGSFWGKGKIYGYQIVGIILRIVFDKNCRRLYTVIKRFINWIKRDEKSEGK